MMGLSSKRRPPAVLVVAAIVATSVLVGCREKTKPPAKKPTRATTQPAATQRSSSQTQPAGQRKFEDALIFVNNYLSGVTNGATATLGSQGWLECGPPGAVSKVSWQYLRTIGPGDVYLMTMAFPPDLPRDTPARREVTYAGVPLVVFEGNNQRVVLLMGRLRNVHRDGLKADDALVLLKESSSRELSFNMDLLATPAAIPALVAVVRDAEGSARMRAAALLGRIGSRDARDALIAALRKTPQPDYDSGSSMRDCLVSAIGECIEREPEKQLLEDLKHGQPQVRWLAAMQLGRRKSVAAVPALIALLDDKHPVGLGATWALGEIGDVRGDEVLFAIVEGRRGGGNAVSAIEAMGKIGTDRALAAVKSIKPDHPGHWMARKVLAAWGSNIRKPATRPATQPAMQPQWGKAVSGVRIGLSPKTISLDPDEKTFTVRVWYENVSRKPQVAPVHKDANMYKLMFAAGTGGKQYYVVYLATRTETIPPRPRPVQPGKRFSETFRFGFIDLGDHRDVWFYLPELKAGDSLTLQAGWTPFGDAGTATHWNDPRTRTSGAITVRRRAATEATDKLLKTDKLPKVRTPQRNKLESAVAALARKAIALKPRHARIGRAGLNPVGLDMSDVLRITGQAKDAAAFTKDHRFYERDVKKLAAAKKLWALCAILDHPNPDAKIHAARALAQLADPASVPILLAAAKTNDYFVSGSENATIHMIYRRTLREAMEKITKLPLMPKGLPKDDASYLEAVDFRKVEAWLAKAAATRPRTQPAAESRSKPAATRSAAASSSQAKAGKGKSSTRPVATQPRLKADYKMGRQLAKTIKETYERRGLWSVWGMLKKEVAAKGKDVLPGLVALVEKGDELVWPSRLYYWQIAACALGDIGDKRAAPFLAARLKDPATRRPDYYFVKPMGQLGVKAVVPRLVRWIQEDDREDRIWGIRSAAWGSRANYMLEALQAITGKDFGAVSGGRVDHNLKRKKQILAAINTWWAAEGRKIYAPLDPAVKSTSKPATVRQGSPQATRRSSPRAGGKTGRDRRPKPH